MAKADYVAPGMTLAEVEAAIASGTGKETAVSGDLAAIDQAITLAGQAAAAWDNRGWWWSRKKNYFATSVLTVATIANSGAVRSSNVSTIKTTAVHGLAIGQDVRVVGTNDPTFNGNYRILTVPSTTTFTVFDIGDDVAAATAGGGSVYVISYVIRTVNSSAMTDFYAPTRLALDDDYRLKPMELDQYDDWLIANTAVSDPTSYALYGDLFLGLLPIPNLSTHIITVNYVQRHSKVTNAGSNDAALIVPGEYQWGVYVGGGSWLLNHETIDPQVLRQCPAFMATMDLMASAEPTHFDDASTIDKFADAAETVVLGGKRFFVTEGGITVLNNPTI